MLRGAGRPAGERQAAYTSRAGGRAGLGGVWDLFNGEAPDPAAAAQPDKKVD